MDVVYKHVHWLLRIALTWIFIVHGYPKIGNNVANLGFVGYLVGPFELLGAIFLLFGYYLNHQVTRIGSLMIAITMVGAIYMHLFKWGDSVSSIEFPVLIISCCILFAVKGNDV
mgnify:FL=1